jgi:esterase/lipase superfamily enzyme
VPQHAHRGGCDAQAGRRLIDRQRGVVFKQLEKLSLSGCRPVKQSLETRIASGCRLRRHESFQRTRIGGEELGARTSCARHSARRVESDGLGILSQAGSESLLRVMNGSTSAPLVAGRQLRVTQRKLALLADLQELNSRPPPPSMNAAPAKPVSWVVVPVYYATTRDLTGASNAEKYYGQREDTLKYGVATITIPEHHRPGKSDGRSWCRFLPGGFNCKRAPSNSVVLSGLSPQRADAWLKEVASVIDSGDNQADALVFVHGFDNSFVDATTRAAQVAYDAGFQGITLTYDWASRNSLPAYVEDQERAERGAPDFEKFLRRIVDSSHARKVAIVAHSMGTRLVLYALRDLQAERPSFRLGQIIFAASDVDSAIFVKQYANKVVHAADLVTLYASSRDRAIRISSNIIHGARRVGSGPPSIVLHQGIDYVDASAIDTDLLGHGYFAENKQLIDDIFLILRHGFPAVDRNLSRIPDGVLFYYRFR